jgi:hypothetical protein
MSTAHLRPLSFGETLDSAFSLYRRHFVPLVITAMIPLIPTMLLTGVFTRSAITSAAAGDSGAYGLNMIPVFVIAAVGTMLMWAALTHQVGEAWTGGEVSVSDGYRSGLRSFFPLLGSMVLMYMVLGGIMMFVFLAGALVFAILAAIGMGIGAAFGGAEGGGMAVLVLAVPLVLLLFAAMLVGSATLFAVLPAVVIEKVGPSESIVRSFRLALGALPRVAGVVGVTFVIVFLPLFVVMAVTGGFAAFTNPGAVPSAGSFWAQQVGNSLTSALTTPFMVASLVILYYDRRVRTEAYDVQLAADALATDTAAAG